MTELVATITALGEGRHRYECEGLAALSPYTLARDLLGAGHDPDRPLRTVWADGSPSMRWAWLGGLAGWTLNEHEKHGLRLLRWRPFLYVRGRSETAEEGSGGVPVPTG